MMKKGLGCLKCYCGSHGHIYVISQILEGCASVHGGWRLPWLLATPQLPPLSRCPAGWQPGISAYIAFMNELCGDLIALSTFLPFPSPNQLAQTQGHRSTRPSPTVASWTRPEPSTSASSCSHSHYSMTGLRREFRHGFAPTKRPSQGSGSFERPNT